LNGACACDVQPNLFGHSIFASLGLAGLAGALGLARRRRRRGRSDLE
jgi:LPXTG-motif cell wall-anchored protein